MSKEEQLADLEESIMMNSSSVGDRALGKRRSTMHVKNQEIGLVDFNQLNSEHKLKSELEDLKSELKQTKELNAKLLSKLQKYKKRLI